MASKSVSKRCASYLEKEAQLGMKFGTASHRLRTAVMFRLVQECERDSCFRCGRRIVSAKDLSIDHKKPWLRSPTSLFWDLSNVTFSHKKCNREAARKPITIPGGKSLRKQGLPGTAWCNRHRAYLPAENFHKNASRWNGYNKQCMECRSVTRLRRAD